MQDRTLKVSVVYSLATSCGVSKHVIIKGKMVSLLLMTCTTLTHFDRGRCRVGALQRT